MKQIVILFFSMILVVSCSNRNEIQVKIENPSAFDRVTEIVEIPLSELSAKVHLDVDQTYVVKNHLGEFVPSQVTFDEKLIFQSGVKANESITYMISAGVPPTFQNKVFGRFVPERKDDLAWENDRVAFRVYGPTLMESDGPSNGIDLWYKRTGNLIIDKWYKDDIAGIASYHEDHGEGLDDYKVGRTLGAGAMGPIVDDSLYLNDNFIMQQVFENGPLRITFKLLYNDIDNEGRSFGENRIFSLDAGSQLTRIIQTYETHDPITVAAGIIKRQGADLMIDTITPKGTASILYAEPFSEKVGNVYVSMVFPTGMDQVRMDTYTEVHPINGKEETHTHYLGLMTYQPGTPITYYAGYGWSKFGFPKFEDYQIYIEQFAESLETPLVITY